MLPHSHNSILNIQILILTFTAAADESVNLASLPIENQSAHMLLNTKAYLLSSVCVYYWMGLMLSNT